MSSEQLSFFDIELPPANEHPIIEAEPIKEEVKEYCSVNESPARVPDDEFQKRQFGNMVIPTVNSILKKIQQDSYAVSIYELLSDVFECGAISISNAFAFNKEREEKYLKIMNKYNEKTRSRIRDIFTDIYFLLSAQIDLGFKDYLGELYMRSETSNGKAGQFFTPYDVSKLCAQISIGKTDIEKYIKEDKILTLNEPTCGAGGMVLAAVDVLYNEHHFNYARNLLVECSDIDMRCVHMTFLQLACAGVPAVIYHRDTITMKTWDRWETPAYVMQYSRFRNVFKTA